MSINGLGDSQINEVYDAIVKDSGGWLLLHYTSRDDVALHAKGYRGPSELQLALARYTEPSPLYGFLVFRRRKFVLKYVPEETSRLLKARTTVHFQTVLDHFSPYDDTITATSPDSVSESALYSRRTLHTANSSASVQQAIRTQQLDGISEDVEDTQSTKPDVASILARIRQDKQALSRSTPRASAEEPLPPTTEEEPPRDSIDDLLDLPQRPKHKSMDLKEALSLDADEMSGSEDSAVHSLGYRRSREDLDPSVRPQTTPASTPTLRSWKPKMRLFTRTIDGSPTDEARERAKLPIGLHIRRAEEEAAAKAKAQAEQEARDARASKSSKRPKSSKRKESRSSQKTPNNDRPEDRSIPPTIHDPSKLLEGRQKDSSPTVAGVQVPEDRFPVNTIGMEAAPTSSSNAEVPARQSDENASMSPAIKKMPAITPERQRLLKALELRKRQEQQQFQTRSGKAPLEALYQQASSIKVPSVNGNEKLASVPHEGSKSMERSLSQDRLIHKLSSTSVSQPQPSAPYKPAEEFDPYRYSDTTEKALPITSSGLTNGDTAGAEGGLQRDYFARPVSGSKETTEKGKRRTLQNITTSDTAVDNSDASSDGSYMEDLQNATLHEAVSISVPQTPVTPAISDANMSPRTDSRLERRTSVASARSALYQLASQGSRQRLDVADNEPMQAGKALAPAALVNIRRPSGNNVTSGSIGPATSIGSLASNVTNSKKTNVSSGISRRIQALEERSQRSTSPVSVNGRSPVDMPQSLFANSQIHGRNMSLASRPSSRGSSRLGSSRMLFKPKPMDSIVDIASSPASKMDGAPASKSFTARIVRSPEKKDRTGSPERRSPQKASFQRSQVIVDPTDASRQDTRIPNALPSSARPASRGSTVSGMTRSSVDFGLKFMGRKKNDNRSPTRPEKSPSVGSLNPVQENEEPKKESKTAKFFKRMSGLSNKSRKSPSDDGTRTLNSIEGRGLATAPPVGRLSLYIVGDLNVQFPDTLFWKRRWVEVDGSGNLVLSGSRGNDVSPIKSPAWSCPADNQRVRTPPKRYHMSSFEQPTIPGPDRQEMPYSIVLDSVNGGTLQFASDDRVSQAQVLKRLSDAHRAWTT